MAAAVLLVAAALLIFLQSQAEAQGNDKATSNLALSSPNPGELAIAWDAPGNAPDDYRVTWKKSTAKWPSYKNANTVEGGNAFPTGASHTVTGLEEGTAYQARVRARYFNDNGDLEKSGPWSETLEMTVAATPPPPPTEEPTAKPTPPAKPTGLSTTPSHNSVMLAWTKSCAVPTPTTWRRWWTTPATRTPATPTTPLRPRRRTSTPSGLRTQTASAPSRKQLQ